ncbi:hypothetical protein AAK967_02385 [Atopobiaceae bacterium 24-176]
MVVLSISVASLLFSVACAALGMPREERAFPFAAAIGSIVLSYAAIVVAGRPRRPKREDRAHGIHPNRHHSVFRRHPRLLDFEPLVTTTDQREDHTMSKAKKSQTISDVLGRCACLCACTETVTTPKDGGKKAARNARRAGDLALGYTQGFSEGLTAASAIAGLVARGEDVDHAEDACLEAMVTSMDDLVVETLHAERSGAE